MNMKDVCRDAINRVRQNKIRNVGLFRIITTD